MHLIRIVALLSCVAASTRGCQVSQHASHHHQHHKFPGRSASLLDLARMMVPASRMHAEQFCTLDFANGLARIPGKALSEKTLPLDRAVANHLLAAEGFAPSASCTGAQQDATTKDVNAMDELSNDSESLTSDSVPKVTTVSNDSLCDSSNGIYYKVYGTGEQKVLMVMGLSASHSGWEYLLPFLAHNKSNYQVAVFDNRGIGKSLCPDNSDDYSMEVFAGDTISVANKLGWDKFHLVGFSMGGMIAQTTASLYPERLLSLALLSTSARRSISERIPPLSELPTLLSWVMARSEEDKAEADLRMHFDDEYLKREFVSGATIKDFWKSVYLSERAENTQGQRWEGFRGQLTALTGFRMKKRAFARIRNSMEGPVLVMQGTKDRIIHPGSGRSLFEYLTICDIKGSETLSKDRCKLVTVEAGHFLPIQKRREVAHALTDLWDKACPDAARAAAEALAECEAAKTSHKDNMLSSVGRTLQGVHKALVHASKMGSLLLKRHHHHHHHDSRHLHVHHDKHGRVHHLHHAHVHERHAQHDHQQACTVLAADSTRPTACIEEAAAQSEHVQQEAYTQELADCRSQELMLDNTPGGQANLLANSVVVGDWGA